MDIEELLVDFYNGALLLRTVATWAQVATDPTSVLDRLSSFESAYEKLVELHADGKVGAGTADFSVENLARVKRILSLVQAGVGSQEAQERAEEVQSLAEGCLKALTGEEARSL